MLVEIESYLGDRLISGRKCSEKQLREKMRQVLALGGDVDFTAQFCRMFGFHEYPLEADSHADHVIDLDTYLVYTPTYDSSEDMREEPL